MIKVRDLAAEARVSPPTIRKAVEQLDELETVSLKYDKKLGTVSAFSESTWFEQSEFGGRVRASSEAKHCLSAVVAKSIHHVLRKAGWVFFDAGSQTLLTSRILAKKYTQDIRGYSVQTNNLKIVLEFLSESHPHIEFHGGLIDRDLGSGVRSDLIRDALNQNTPDLVCMSFHNVSIPTDSDSDSDSDNGDDNEDLIFDLVFHANNDAETRGKRVVSKAANDYVFIVFDSSKMFHRTGDEVSRLSTMIKAEHDKKDPLDGRRRLVIATDTLLQSNKPGDLRRHLAFETRASEYLNVPESVATLMVLGRATDNIDGMKTERCSYAKIAVALDDKDYELRVHPANHAALLGWEAR